MVAFGEIFCLTLLVTFKFQYNINYWFVNNILTYLFRER